MDFADNFTALRSSINVHWDYQYGMFKTAQENLALREFFGGFSYILYCCSIHVHNNYKLTRIQQHKCVTLIHFIIRSQALAPTLAPTLKHTHTHTHSPQLHFHKLPHQIPMQCPLLLTSIDNSR